MWARSGVQQVDKSTQMITEAGNKIAAESHFQSLVIGGETESECTKKLAA